MASPILNGFLSQLAYPAALAMSGFGGNVYILGGQITEIKEDMKEVKDDIKDIRGDIKTLVARQTELERRDMSLAEKVLTNRGKKR